MSIPLLFPSGNLDVLNRRAFITFIAAYFDKIRPLCRSRRNEIIFKNPLLASPATFALVMYEKEGGRNGILVKNWKQFTARITIFSTLNHEIEFRAKKADLAFILTQLRLTNPGK